MNGLEPFQQGGILVNGQSVGDKKTNLSKLRSKVGMVFQHFELFPHLSITENLTLAQVKVLGRGKDEANEKGMKLLERVGLKAHAHKFPASCRAASSSVSRSRVRCRWTRSRCCSTSRRPRSTPR